MLVGQTGTRYVDLGNPFSDVAAPYPLDAQFSMDDIVESYLSRTRTGPKLGDPTRRCASHKKPYYVAPDPTYGCPSGYVFMTQRGPGTGTPYAVPICALKDAWTDGCLPGAAGSMTMIERDMNRYGGGRQVQGNVSRLPPGLARRPRPLPGAMRAPTMLPPAVASAASPGASPAVAAAAASALMGYSFADAYSGRPITMLGAASGGTITGLLKLGSKGAQVGLVQSYLNSINIFVDVNDTFDALTDDGVKQFQSMHGLKADGVVGHDTATAMGLTYAAGGGGGGGGGGKPTARASGGGGNAGVPLSATDSLLTKAEAFASANKGKIALAVVLAGLAFYSATRPAPLQAHVAGW